MPTKPLQPLLLHLQPTGSTYKPYHGHVCLAVLARQSEGHVHIARFTLTEAGPFTLTLGLEGAEGCRVYNNICRPGLVSVPHCKVLSVDSCLTAGQTGQIRLQRRDR